MTGATLRRKEIARGLHDGPESDSAVNCRVVMLDGHVVRDFIIWGIPVSHQAKNRKAIQNWQEKVASAARDAISEDDKCIQSDLSLLLIFFHVDELPADLDNLAKSTLDGMSTRAFGDDGQIAQLTLRRTRLEPSLSIETTSPSLVEALPQAIGEERDFVYVRLDPPPDHRRLP